MINSNIEILDNSILELQTIANAIKSEYQPEVVTAEQIDNVIIKLSDLMKELLNSYTIKHNVDETHKIKATNFHSMHGLLRCNLSIEPKSETLNRRHLTVYNTPVYDIEKTIHEFIKESEGDNNES